MQAFKCMRKRGVHALMYDSGEEDIVQDIVVVGWAAFQWSQKSREDWVDEVD